MKNKLIVSLSIILALVVIILSVLILPFGVQVRTAPGHLSLSIGMNQAQAADDVVDFKTGNKITTLKDGVAVDLTTITWLDAEKVSLQIEAEKLPDNVRVIGTPRLDAPIVIDYDPLTSAFGVGGVWCYPRVVIDGKPLYVQSDTKTATAEKATALTATTTVGVTGNLYYEGNTLPYYSRIYASQSLDNFGVQVGFTTPFRIDGYRYEYVFIPGDADTIQLWQSIEPAGMMINEYRIETTKETDITSVSTHVIHFMRDGKQITQYKFLQLKLAAQSTTWRIENVDLGGEKEQLAVIVSFGFERLEAGATFHNDGYFGGTTQDDDEQCAAGRIFGSRYQNTVGDGNITQMEIYGYAYNSDQIAFGVYADSSGPAALVADAGDKTVSPAAEAWHTLSGLSIAVTNGTNYWLSFAVNPKHPYIGLVTGASNTGFYSGTGQTFGTFPNPLTGETLTTTNYQIRAYVVLSVGGDPSLTNTPSSKDMGTLWMERTYYAKGNAPGNPVETGNCTFTITNDGSITENITISITNLTGGTTWTPVSGSPGASEYRITFYYAGQNPASGVVGSTSAQTFYNGLAASGTLTWDFKFETGTWTNGDTTQRTGTIQLTAITP